MSSCAEHASLTDCGTSSFKAFLVGPKPRKSGQFPAQPPLPTGLESSVLRVQAILGRQRPKWLTSPARDGIRAAGSFQAFEPSAEEGVPVEDSASPSAINEWRVAARFQAFSFRALTH